MHFVLKHEEWLVETSNFTWNCGSKWRTFFKTATSNRYSLVAPQP